MEKSTKYDQSNGSAQWLSPRRKANQITSISHVVINTQGM